MASSQNNKDQPRAQPTDLGGGKDEPSLKSPGYSAGGGATVPPAGLGNTGMAAKGREQLGQQHKGTIASGGGPGQYGDTGVAEGTIGGGGLAGEMNVDTTKVGKLVGSDVDESERNKHLNVATGGGGRT
ncbi:Gas vesicle protein [Balamuthia mandrillaris]